ncbi:DNA polymerase III subunit gamma and tau [Nocardioidaceae bacterium]|nr:DNA polymerase III subunit gamma and tau [Nocardioidaceae bacterium]
MDAPLALYRRYRPETFDEVIGQDHVTEPLRAALASNRVNHAYLFSGPRGCGKTTSARIMARCLNCEQGPTPTPCGVCQSCRDLARGGPGSIDVIEIDAASHGRIEDTRDLREKAFFAPVASRYKIYVIDEAHMVTVQGFNALLKLVEEPPPHLKFIFATTEPEKVIGTIRSRTHHYPFRLIPPRTLADYLGQLCDAEGVAIEPAALPLVVRAGGGSARDTLSVLDQLIGGSGEAGVTLQLTTSLLGYTPDSLLDDVVEAFAAHDGGTVFGAVDRVVESGQDPRRFTEDLLRRLRDLVVIKAVPDASVSGLVDVGEDAAERLVGQANRFGAAELSRAADLVAVGLTEMRGATAPRLLLELICARVLLPAADDTTSGVLARLDRLERRVSIEGGTPSGEVASSPTTPGPAQRPQTRGPEGSAPGTSATPRDAGGPTRSPDQRPVHGQDAYGQPAAGPQAASEAARSAEPTRPHQTSVGSSGAAEEQPGEHVEQPPSSQPRTSADEPAPAAPPGPTAPSTSTTSESVGEPVGASGLTMADVRRVWPDVVEAVKERRRITWIHLTSNAQVLSVADGVLTLGFHNAGARDSFAGGGSPEVLRQAVIDVVGADWRVDAIVQPGATPGGAPAESAPPQQGRQAPRQQPSQPPAQQAAPPERQAPAQDSQEPPGWDVPRVPRRDEQQPPAAPSGDSGATGAPVASEAPRAPVDLPEPPDEEEPPPPADPGWSGAGRSSHPDGQDATAGTGPSAVADAGAQPRRRPWEVAAERQGAGRAEAGPAHVPDDEADPDDPSVDAGLGGAELLERELGAQLIEEIRHDQD